MARKVQFRSLNLMISSLAILSRDKLGFTAPENVAKQVYWLLASFESVLGAKLREYYRKSDFY